MIQKLLCYGSLSLILPLSLVMADTHRGNSTANFPQLTYFVIEGQAAPLQIEQNGSQHRGIVSDLVFLLTDSLGISVNVVSLPFKRMVSEMKKPEARNWLAYGSPAWQSNSKVSVQSDCLFSDPILEVTHSLVTRVDDEFTLDSVQDLFGQRLITLHGFDYPGLASYFEQGSIQRLNVKSLNSAFKAVAARRGLGFVGMDIRVAYNFSASSIPRSNYRIQDLSFLIPSYPVHLSVDCRMDRALQQSLNEGYRSLIDSGSVERVLNQYLKNNVVLMN
jgi:polar amino acid transport system substrate-binding protein